MGYLLAHHYQPSRGDIATPTPPPHFTDEKTEHISRCVSHGSPNKKPGILAVTLGSEPVLLGDFPTPHLILRLFELLDHGDCC